MSPWIYWSISSLRPVWLQHASSIHSLHDNEDVQRLSEHEVLRHGPTWANHQLTTSAVQGFKHAPHTLSLISSRSRSVNPICMYLSLDVLMVVRGFKASYGALFHGLHHCLASAVLDHARELDLQNKCRLRAALHESLKSKRSKIVAKPGLRIDRGV